MNYDWVWPLAVGFLLYFFLQFFGCFLPLLDLVSGGL